MAIDIATLGIEIDLDNIDAAIQRMEKMASTSKRATDALNEFSGGSRNVRSATQQMEASAKSATGQMEKMEKSTTSLALSFKQTATAMMGMFTAYKSFMGLDSLIQSGFAYNEQLEKAQLGIAAVVASTMDLVDANGQALQAQEKFTAAQKMSVEMAKQLDVASMQSPAGYTDLLSTFQTLLAPANQLGLKWQDTLDITIKMSNVLSSLGLDMQSLARETQSILTGANLSKSNVASRLGITKEEIQSWKTGIELMENFQKRFEAFKYAGAAVEDTMEAVREYYEDVIRNASGDAFTSLWTASKKAMLEVADAFYEIDEASGKFRKTEEWEALSQIIDGISAAIGDRFISVVESAVGTVKELGQYVSQVGTDEVFERLERSATVAAAAIGALVVIKKGYLNTATSMIASLSNTEKALTAKTRAAREDLATAKQQLASYRSQIATRLELVAASRNEQAAFSVRQASWIREKILLDQVTAAQTRYMAAMRSDILRAAKSGFQGIISMLGGPMGAALTAATVGFTLLATTESDAEKATKALELAENNYAKATEGATDSAGRLTGALSELQKAKLEISKSKYEESILGFTQELQKELTGLLDRGGEYTGDWWSNLIPNSEDNAALAQYKKEINDIFDSYKNGEINANALAERLGTVRNEMEKNSVCAKETKDELNKIIEGDLLDNLVKAETGLDRTKEALNRASTAADQTTTSVANLQSQMAQGFQINTGALDSFLENTQKEIRSAQMTMAGLQNVASLGNIFPELSAQEIKSGLSGWSKNGAQGMIKAMERQWQKANMETRIQMLDAFEAAYNKDLTAKQLEEYRSNSRQSSKSAASAATKAAVAQNTYTSELEKTKNSVTSLQQQLNTDKTESLTEAKIKAEEKYQQALLNTDKTISNQLARGSITQAQATELRAQKEMEASLQKELTIKKAQEKQESRNLQITQGQLKFYKEFASLSGTYTDNLDLQKTLISQRAQAYREEYGIAEDLVAKWEELQLLQVSNDPFDGAYRGLLKYSAELSNTGSQWEEISYNFAKNFMSNTRDMFDDFLDTGQISFDSFQTMFKQLLKDLAWQALAQPIMLSVISGVAGVSATSGTAQAGTVSTALLGGNAGGSGSILDTVSGLGQQAGTRYLFNGSGSDSFIGGITASINSAVSDMFPSLFASSAQAATTNAALNIGNTSINAANNVMAQLHGTGSVAALPTSAPTSTFTSALAPAGIGAGIGAMASPFVNNLLGIENNTGSQVGSMVGGGLGALAGAFIPGAGWIAGGIAALASLVGGGIGSLFGMGQQEQPELYLASGVNLWERYDKNNSGETTWDGEPSFHGNGYFSWGTGAQGTGYWSAYQPVASIFNVLEAGQQTANAFEDALRGVDDAMGDQFIQNLQNAGRIMNEVYYEGKDINQENLQNYINSISTNIQGTILGALSEVDLTPLTIAADGFAADTAEEVGTAISKILSFGTLGDIIEDETIKSQFRDNYINQMVNALDNVSLAPLTRAADGFAVDTVEELTTALEDVFAAWDVGETIQDEEIKAAYQAKMQELIEHAFDNVDLSFLRVDFDKNSFSGLQQAYAATQAWDKVVKGLDEILDPASEFESTMNAATEQFDSWISSLKELGWQEEAIAEIEAKRTQYMFEYRKALEQEMAQSLSLRLSSLRYGSDSNQYALQNLLFQQANERESTKNKFGEDHPLYAATVQMQKAEMTQTLLNQLMAERDKLLAKEQQAAQDNINAEQALLQDKSNAIQTEISATRERISAIQQEINAAESLANTWRRIARNLEEYRRDMWSGENNLTGSRYQDAYSQFDSLFQKAMTGDEDAFNDLTGKASELLQLGQEQLPERGEYNDLFYDVDQKLKQAEIYAYKQVTEAEKQADTLTQQLTALEKQQATLEAQLDALNGQNDALNAQLEALQQQTGVEEESLYTLEQIEAAIGALDMVLKQQIQDAQQSYMNAANTGWDWDYLLQEKANAMNAGLTLASGQIAGGWTAEKVLAEIQKNGMTVQDWYDLYGKQEGFTVKTAASITGALDNGFLNLDGNLESYLKGNTKTLNASLIEQLEQAMLTGADINSILDTENANWPATISSICGLGDVFSSSFGEFGDLFSTSFDSLGTSLAEALKAASKNSATSQATSSSGATSSATSSTSTSTSTGSGSSTTSTSTNITTSQAASTGTDWNKILQAKADAMNAGSTLAQGQQAGGWTASSVLDAINKTGLTTQEWYDKYGKAEGFAKGGITPMNQVFMVGENGPELMVSPRQWGVLNNEATRMLMERESRPYEEMRQYDYMRRNEENMLFGRSEREMRDSQIWSDRALDAIEAMLQQSSAPRIEAPARKNEDSEINSLRQQVAVLTSYVRQLVVKADKTAYACDKMMNIQRGFQSEGMPVEILNG